jgi:FtsP/CotA-like multicopper oxidase with cupredoxin domain
MRMEGGAMGGMMQGGMQAMQEMVSRGMVWALNGASGMQDAPLIEVARGETLRIPIMNHTAFPHAMHLHGHHFHQITDTGPGPARDTILTSPNAHTEIAFVADNPGDWMFHCHMLSHQMTGMMSWIRVV